MIIFEIFNINQELIVRKGTTFSCYRNLVTEYNSLSKCSLEQINLNDRKLMNLNEYKSELCVIFLRNLPNERG